MDSFSVIYIFVLFASLIVSLFICGFVWRLRHEDLSRHFFHFMLMVVYTSFAFLVYQLVLSEPVALFWAKARFIGIAGAGLMLLRFVFAYTNRPDWLKLTRLLPLLIVPILVQIVIWTPSLTHYFRSDWTITLAGLNTESGVVSLWFQVHILSTSAYIVWGIVLLGQQAAKTVGIFRWQAITLMIGVAIAMVSGYSYLLPGKLPPFLPIGLTTMSVMIAVALFRLHMVDLVPIARDTVFDQITDIVFVLDMQHRIIDLNQAALEVLPGYTRADLIGKSTKEVFAAFPQAIERFYNLEQTQEVVMSRDQERFYDIRISPIYRQKQPVGRLVILHNITQRTQAERKLRENENLFTTILNMALEAIISIDESQKIIQFSEGAERIFGYQAAEVLGADIGVLLPTNFAHIHTGSINEFLASPTNSRYMGERQEVFGRRRNGDLFPAEASISKIKQGQQFIMTVVMRDITERKQIEQVVREREKRFRSLIEKSSDLVITVDRTGTITYVSPASQQVTTYDETDMLGRNILEIFIPSPQEAVDEQIKQHMRQMLANSVKDNIQLETQIIGKDGQVIWLRGILTNLLDDPDIGALVANIHNVTALKQAIAKEQQESSFVKLLLELATIQGEGHSLHNVLERILAQLSVIFPNDGINIMLIEDAIGKVVAVSGYSAEKASDMMQQQVNFTDFPTFQHILHTKKPLLVPDTKSNPIWTRRDISEDLDCYLGVPIILSNKVIGIINLHHRVAHSFHDEIASRIYAIASYIAVVIHNFQAYEDVKERTIHEERQHLARELHDAVSQTLFSASMISETLPRLLDHDVKTVRAGLEELTTLTKGALAEMRLLLIELRPSALREITLNVLLDNLINGFKARIADAEVEVDLKCDTDDLSLDIKLALYRVAQEALNNVMKHARPKHVRIMCHCQHGEINMLIADDGIGFNPKEIQPTQFGLHIMRERAEQTGLTLLIESQIGVGSVTRLSGQF